MKKIKIILPTIIVDEIDLIYPTATLKQRNIKNRALIGIKLIETLSLRQNGCTESFAEISSNYFRKAIGSDYRQVLQKAIDHNIIEVFKNKDSKESYTVDGAINTETGLKNSKGISKMYQIAKKFSFNNSIIINNSNLKNNNSINNQGVFICRHILENPLLSNVSVEVKTSLKTDEDLLLERQFEKMMSTLNMDYDFLTSEAIDIVNNLKAEDFEISKYEDKDKIIRVHFGKDFRSYPMEIGVADFKAKLRGKKLYKIDKKYYIDTPGNFITRLRANRINAYLEALSCLKNGNLRASRNKKNNRLDTNFTNLLARLVDLVCERNNLVQKDLKNSQFVILANYLKNQKGLNTPDFNRFYSLAISGKLYEKIAETIGIERKEAKVLMFNILFNKINANIEHKDLMYSMFPSLMAYIDNFKKRRTYKGFSVFLQRLESKMFIDNLYKSIYEATGFVLTKHDSLIVRKEDSELVDRIIEKYFKDNNFKGIITNG